ncbi:MAG TPA: phasin [Rhizobiales bacterium]|nr:phasin [Hyphomicrobiales bacterium]
MQEPGQSNHHYSVGCIVFERNKLHYKDSEMTTAKAPAAKKAAPKTAAKAAPKAPAAKKEEVAKDIFAMPSFELPNMDLSTQMMPEMVRDMAEKGVAKARENYASVRAAAEEQNAAVEKSLDTAREAGMELNKKALDAAQANVEAGFNFFRDILSVKSVGDAIELQTTFARSQFDAVSAQTKDFQETVNKGAQEIAAPVQEAINKNLDAIKAA